MHFCWDLIILRIFLNNAIHATKYILIRCRECLKRALFNIFLPNEGPIEAKCVSYQRKQYSSDF